MVYKKNDVVQQCMYVKLIYRRFFLGAIIYEIIYDIIPKYIYTSIFKCIRERQREITYIYILIECILLSDSVACVYLIHLWLVFFFTKKRRDVKT